MLPFSRMFTFYWIHNYRPCKHHGTAPSLAKIPLFKYFRASSLLSKWSEHTCIFAVKCFPLPRQIVWVLDFLCENISGKVKVVPARVKSPFWWRVTRGAHNPNLQIVIMHVSCVWSKLSFRPPLRMNGMQRMQFDHTVFWPSIPVNLITHVLTICHVKFMQSTMLEWKPLTFRHCRPHSVTFGDY